jgi:hypothetical protein
VSKTSTKETVIRVITTAPVVLEPTSFGPPLVVNPHPQAMIAIKRPNTNALTSINGRSDVISHSLTEFQKMLGGI